MRVLLTHRYFWPDTAPYAAMLRAIGDALAKDGHDVDVFSGRPSYRETTEKRPRRETLGNLRIWRCWVIRGEKRNPALRLTNVIIYCWALFWKVIWLRPDVVTVSTFPPVVAAWSVGLAARMAGAKLIYHMQDVHPEVSIYSSKTDEDINRKARSLTMRVLRWLDNQTVQRAAAVVVLSQDMANTLEARGFTDMKIHLINNFSLDLYEAAEESPPASLIKKPGTLRVIFAGNLGNFQNLPLMAEGVALCFSEHPNLELLFLGDGSALPALKARWWDNPQVTFGPFLPFAQAKPLISDSDVGLVSLASNIYRVSSPSKVLTYAGLALPMLALVEPKSSLARDLRDSGMGVVPESATPEGIAKALQSLLSRPPTPSEGVRDRWGTQSRLDDWTKLIAEL